MLCHLDTSCITRSNFILRRRPNAKRALSSRRMRAGPTSHAHRSLSVATLLPSLSLWPHKPPTSTTTASVERCQCGRSDARTKSASHAANSPSKSLERVATVHASLQYCIAIRAAAIYQVKHSDFAVGLLLTSMFERIRH